jgi:hypothetical protein
MDLNHHREGRQSSEEQESPFVVVAVTFAALTSIFLAIKHFGLPGFLFVLAALAVYEKSRRAKRKK